MSKKRKLLGKVLAGSNNIQFDELVLLVEAFGFRLSRINGSHHIFIHPEIPDIVNLQNKKGKAVPYQVRQFLSLIEVYDLTFEDEP
jgi:predicted RNA binding protein YcfA (HicA-like mRNA interferase family)